MQAESFNFAVALGAMLFSLGALGVLIRRDVLIVLMCIELMLNGVNLTFVAVSAERGAVGGQVFALLVMAVAAAEAAVGLAIAISLFRNFRTADIDGPQSLKG